jgi:hypothetical protein
MAANVTLGLNMLTLLVGGHQNLQTCMLKRVSRMLHRETKQGKICRSIRMFGKSSPRKVPMKNNLHPLPADAFIAICKNGHSPLSAFP